MTVWQLIKKRRQHFYEVSMTVLQVCIIGGALYKAKSQSLTDVHVYACWIVLTILMIRNIMNSSKVEHVGKIAKFAQIGSGIAVPALNMCEDSARALDLWLEESSEDKDQIMSANTGRVLSLAVVISDPRSTMWIWDSLRHAGDHRLSRFFGIKIQGVSDGNLMRVEDELGEKLEGLRQVMFKRGLEEEYFEVVEGKNNEPTT